MPWEPGTWGEKGVSSGSFSGPVIRWYRIRFFDDPEVDSIVLPGKRVPGEDVLAYL